MRVFSLELVGLLAVFCIVSGGWDVVQSSHNRTAESAAVPAPTGAGESGTRQEPAKEIPGELQIRIKDLEAKLRDRLKQKLWGETIIPPVVEGPNWKDSDFREELRKKMMEKLIPPDLRNKLNSPKTHQQKKQSGK